MDKKILVFDFDGTLTLPDKEVDLFRDGVMEDLAGLTGEEYSDIYDLCSTVEKEILENPEKFAVMNNGKPSARATDPYCMWDVIARRVFDSVGVFSNKEDQARIIDVLLFKYNYRKAATVFNPQAKNVLKTLMEERNDVETFIVSTSHAESLRVRVRLLARKEKGGSHKWVEKLANRSYGSAGKFHLDDSFDKIKEYWNFEGMSRPIYLRRRKYHGVLMAILENYKSNWQDMIVVGDHFELDLVVPWYFGAKIGLVVNNATPKYEIDSVQQLKNGYIIKDLREIFEILE